MAMNLEIKLKINGIVRVIKHERDLLKSDGERLYSVWRNGAGEPYIESLVHATNPFWHLTLTNEYDLTRFETGGISLLDLMRSSTSIIKILESKVDKSVIVSPMAFIDIDVNYLPSINSYYRF
jgi:hypothetical protein